MKGILAGLLTGGMLLAGASSVLADGYEKKEYKPAMVYGSPYNWSGIYVGLQAGYGWGKGNATIDSGIPFFDNLGATHSYSPKGLFGGGQIGIQQQSGAFVYGVDLSLLSLSVSNRIGDPIAPAQANERLSITSLALLTGRLGYAVNNWLFYVKGGYAGGLTDFKAACETCGPVTIDVGSRHNGWVVGAGVDYGITKNITLGLDYSYVKLNTATDTSNYHTGPGNVPVAGAIAGYATKTDTHLVGLRLNYLFGRDAEVYHAMK